MLERYLQTPVPLETKHDKHLAVNCRARFDIATTVLKCSTIYVACQVTVKLVESANA